ncbi:MAG: uroporphyrinogen decarboxylase family protein [Deltaproteobacteria bacterium]|nr:uroporphyrinogen decarboxylase family protein [Deltaproteobacteria bacterium]
MNSRERVKEALLCRKPDRIPIALGFFNQSFEAIAPTAAEDYFDLDIRYAEFSPPRDQNAFRRYLDRLPEDVHVGNQAQLRTYHEWQYHPEKGTARPLSSVRSLKELVKYVLPDLANPTRHAGLSKQVQRWHTQGYAVAGMPPHLGGELFETAWRLRGFENFMIDLADRNDIIAYLLDQLTSMLIENALILARAGVDILLLDDDVAMPTGLMISPDTWRYHFKDRLATVINTAREESPNLLIFYHSDGDFTQLIPDLVDIGINVINPVQPDCMDGAAIKREFGDRLAMWGTVGTARLWDEGSPEQIRSEVRRCIETMGPEGLLLAPAYDIDFAPFENIVAFVEAVKDFSRI